MLLEISHSLVVYGLIGLVGALLMGFFMVANIAVLRREGRDAALQKCGELQLRLDRTTSAGADLASKVGWRKQRLMNKPEFALYCELCALVTAGRAGHRLFAQVDFGAFLEVMAREDRKEIADAAYHVVHRKVADFLLIDRFGNPVAVIEYQGAAHYQGNAHARDHAKRVACQSANIHFIEVPATGLTMGQKTDLRWILGLPAQLAAK